MFLHMLSKLQETWKKKAHSHSNWKKDHNIFAQFAGAEEYTDCFSAEW